MLQHIQRKRSTSVLQRNDAVPAETPASEREETASSGASGAESIYTWLKNKADKQGKASLFTFFAGLTPLQRIEAVKKMSGTSGLPSLEKFADAMSTRWNFGFKKTVDWDKFSVACREAKQMKTADYNADQTRDYASYAASGSSGLVGAAGGGATIAKEAGSGSAGAAAAGLAPFGAGLSGLGSAAQVYGGVRNYSSSMDAHDAAQTIGGEIGGGLADAARFSAQTADTAGKALGATVSAAATTAAAAAGVVGGAAYLATGAAGAYKHNERYRNLSGLAERSAGKDDALARAASLGADTQKLNRNKSAATALKGAAMIAGGALLLAGMGPIGWVLLGVAGVIGGAAAIYKFWKKRARKEEIVDRYLQVDEKMSSDRQDPKDKNAKQKARETLMQQNGFNTIDQCYTHIVTELAHTIYEKGVQGGEEEYLTLLKNIGLTVNKEKTEPKPELIAKKLHS